MSILTRILLAVVILGLASSSTGRRRHTGVAQAVHARHEASRYDRTPKSLRDLIERDDKAGAHWIGLTEVADPERRKVLHHYPGWTCHQAPMKDGKAYGECAILTRDSMCTLTHGRAHKIGPDLGPGDIVVTYAGIIEYHDTGVTGATSETHYPASVESDFLARRARRVVAYVAASRRQRLIAKKLRRDHRPDFEAHCGDFNVNANRGPLAKSLGGLFPGMKLVPGKGWTHAGRRRIDAWFVRWLRHAKTKTLAVHPSSDHRGVALYAIARKKARR